MSHGALTDCSGKRARDTKLRFRLKPQQQKPAIFAGFFIVRSIWAAGRTPAAADRGFARSTRARLDQAVTAPAAPATARSRAAILFAAHFSRSPGHGRSTLASEAYSDQIKPRTVAAKPRGAVAPGYFLIAPPRSPPSQSAAASPMALSARPAPVAPAVVGAA